MPFGRGRAEVATIAPPAAHQACHRPIGSACEAVQLSVVLYRVAQGAPGEGSVVAILTAAAGDA